MQNPTSRHLLILFVVLIACGAAFYKVGHHSLPFLFQPASIAMRSGNPIPLMNTHFVSTRQNISTHAASLIELNDGGIRAFWFAGSREGADDVEIRTAVFDGKQWSGEQSVINREQTQQALSRYVKKLGNPVPVRAMDGSLWLYYVTVSLGGWAGSSITAMNSHDEGATWSAPRRLITSPFINISTLIKGTPFAYSDGTIGLPIYHEFLGKFGELLRFSQGGEVLDKQRLSSGKLGIQPIVLVQNDKQATVLMRHVSAPPKLVIATHTEDGGQHWSTPSKTTLANPDAAIAGVSLPDGRILVVLNNLGTGRNALSLLVSADRGVTWQSIYQLEDQQKKAFVSPDSFAQTNQQLAKQTEANITDANGYAQSAQRNKCVAQQCDFEFSYPYLIQTHSGDFHLVYTWNRSFIKHVQFSRVWLNEQIAKTSSHAELH
ncbi:MAG: exo-alpha-sialidase [Gallionella sp.]|nr:exo-alpha-sialidase [Gallionella sp.]